MRRANALFDPIAAFIIFMILLFIISIRLRFVKSFLKNAPRKCTANVPNTLKFRQKSGETAELTRTAGLTEVPPGPIESSCKKLNLYITRLKTPAGLLKPRRSTGMLLALF
ncbi:MAG: hypothetical protein HDT26_05855 [Subdoligranulum sp.]|nr:hypothetical protein [Subdoligranulum sp.]